MKDDAQQDLNKKKSKKETGRRVKKSLMDDLISVSASKTHENLQEQMYTYCTNLNFIEVECKAYK